MGNQFFETLNSYFDHIYVITLKRCKERHLLLRQNLKGLNYELFWGVEGMELELNQLEAENLYHSGLTQLILTKNGRAPKDMPLAKIGSALSKNLVYKDIVKNHYESTLILEDDVLFDKSKSNYIKQALHELPDNWDILYFGYWGNTKPVEFKQKVKNLIISNLSKLLIKHNTKAFENKYPRKYSNRLDKSGRHYGTYSFAVSLNGAKKILKYSTHLSSILNHAQLARMDGIVFNGWLFGKE